MVYVSSQTHNQWFRYNDNHVTSVTTKNVVEDNARQAYLVFYQHRDYLLDSADPNDGTVPAKHITPDPNPPVAVARPKPRIPTPEATENEVKPEAEVKAEVKPAHTAKIKLPMFRMSRPVTFEQVLESSPVPVSFSNRLGMRTTKPVTPSQTAKMENLKLR